MKLSIINTGKLANWRDGDKLPILTGQVSQEIIQILSFHISNEDAKKLQNVAEEDLFDALDALAKEYIKINLIVK